MVAATTDEGAHNFCPLRVLLLQGEFLTKSLIGLYFETQFDGG
jgi:hypothetical protein